MFPTSMSLLTFNYFNFVNNHCLLHFPVKNIELTPEHREALSKWNFDSFVEKKVYLLHLSPF